MVYPQTRLPVVVEVAPGAAPAADPGTWRWVDVSTSARVGDGVTIGAGRGDWGQDTDPGTCSLAFNNPAGDFSEHNPLGQWYGQLGKDTPLRVRLRRGEDQFARTVAAGWGTAPSGQTWSLIGAGGTVLLTDASVAGGVGYLRVPAVAASRAMLLGSYLRDVEVVVTGQVAVADITGGVIEPLAVLLRVQDDLNTQYMARVEVSAAEAVTVVLYGPSGTLASAPVPIVWTGQPLRMRAGISGQQVYARVWDPTGVEPTGWHVSAVDQSATALRVRGRIGVRGGVGAGNTNTKPVEFRFTDLQVLVDLGGGFVPAWMPDSDLSGKIRTVSVTAQGTLYRHKPGQSSPPVVSPWRRMVTTKAVPGLLAYWPCEDDVSATRAASGMPGGSPMTAGGTVVFAGYDDAFFTNAQGYSLGFGAGLLPGTTGGNRVANLDKATLTGVVPAGASSPIRWSVCWMARPVTSGATYPMMRWDTPGGSIDRWEYRHANVSTQSGLFGRQASDGLFVQFASLFDDTPRLREYRVEAWQDSVGGIGLRLWVDGVKISDAFWTATIGRVTQVVANPTAADVDALAVGHVQVWDTENPPRLGVEGLTATAQPTDGYGVKIYPYQRWVNETAHNRLARLAAEDGIGIDIPPVDAALAARMGQQPDGTALDLYRDCVATDGGVLYERGFSLGYRTRQSLYNQTPAITLDARSDLADVPVPDGSGQRYRNRWTLTRSGGSSVVAETADVAAGALPYPASDDVSLAGDAQLPDQAGWRLRLTSDKGLRWPQLELNMWAHPELLDAWLSTRIGDRIVASATPADVAGRGIDVLLEGYSLKLGYKSFEVTANCSPSWLVAAADGDARPGAAGSTLVTGLSSSGMSLLLTSAAGGGAWTTDPADFPLDIRVGGEQTRASAIASSFSDTLDRTVAPGGWGSPWSVVLGSASAYSVDGTRGVIGLTGTSRHAIVVDAGSPEQDAILSIRSPVTATGGSIMHGWMGRYVDIDNHHYVEAQFRTDGRIWLALFARAGGVNTTIAAAVNVMAYTAGTTYRLGMQLLGNVFRARVWPGGAPPGWQITGAATATPAGTKAGVRALLAAGNTNTQPVNITVDNVEVLVPQLVTLSARGLNGVQRAWPAGTEVDVWTPAVFGL